MPMAERQKIGPAAAITAISWTGGKDCNLALLRAWRNGNFNVRYLIVFCLSKKPFQAHPIQFMKAQAKSLGLKIIFVNFPEEVNDWMTAYVEAISRARDEHGIQVISTGDINLVGTMQRNWMERACEGAGIKCYLPLWEIDKEKTLDIMLEEGFEIIFSCVKAPFFDKTWITRRLDQKAIQEMKVVMNKDLTREQIESGLKPLDLCGERGEYHTMCIDGPLYTYRIQMDFNPEPMRQEIQQTQWKGNIHNSNCIWAISLATVSNSAAQT